MLEIADLDVAYGKRRALQGVSLTVGAGEIVTLLGANGSGKSTTLRAVSGLVRAARGSIRYDGRDLGRAPADAIVAAGIGHVPEGRDVFTEFTVLENLLVGAHTVPAREVPARLEAAYALFPVLRERRRQRAGTLSGGEQQMLAISRAMMLEPKIILLDEPTEGLMPRMVSQIREIISVLHGEGVAILLVEQNVPLTLDACQRIYFMEKGAVRHHAVASELSVNDPVIHQYLGV